MELKKNLQPNDIVAKLYYLDGGLWTFYGYLENGILENVTMTLNYIAGDELTLKFPDYGIFEQYYKLSLLYTLKVEIMIYNDEEMKNEIESGEDYLTSSSLYNNVFFIAKNSVSETYQNENSYQLYGMDWKGFIEYRRWLTHNVFYNSGDIPIGENGEQQFPDDFNKIKFYGTNMADQLKYFYTNDIIDPYTFAKGYEPSKGAEWRKVKSYLATELIVNDTTLVNYDTLQERKSLGEYKEKYYNTAFDNGEFAVSRVEAKVIPQGTQYGLQVVYNPQQTHVISNIFGTDEVTEASADVDATDYFNNIYIESDKNDFLQVSWQNIKATDMTSFEYGETASEDDGDVTSMENYAKELLNEKAELVTRTAMLYFAEKEYLKEVKIGDKVQLTDFNDLLNGDFIISKLTMVIEGNTVDFSIDEMKQI